MRSEESEDAETGKTNPDPAGRFPAPVIFVMTLEIDRLGLEAADQHSVLDRRALGKVPGRIVEYAGGCGQYLDIVVGGQPFGQHAAVGFGPTVHLFPVTDDDEGDLFHVR